MSKSNTFENDILALIFNGTAIGNIADNAGSSPLTQLWASLHTADPGEAGTQGTSEASFTGYTRIAVARSTAGFVVSGNVASPVSAINFPQATSTSTGTITHVGIGVSSASTSGKLLYSGTLAPNANYGQNVTISVSTGTQITED